MSRPWRSFPPNLHVVCVRKCHGLIRGNRLVKWGSCAIEGWKDVTKFHSGNRKRCHGTVAEIRLIRATIREPQIPERCHARGPGWPRSGDSASPKDVTGRTWVSAKAGSGREGSGRKRLVRGVKAL